MRRDPFDRKGFSRFEETVAVRTTAADGDGIARSGNVRATVIVGAGLSQGAGASVNSETADRISVVIRRSEWLTAFPFPPRFGAAFIVDRIGEVKVKQVTAGAGEFVCRCSQNMRAREK